MPKKKELTDEQITNKVLTFIDDTRGNEALCKKRDDARSNQDFFRGHHWDAETHAVYKSKGVEPVTINRCRPVIKGINGMYLQNRTAIRIFPRRRGTEVAAQVYTELIKHTEDMSYSDKAYADMFLRGTIDAEAYILLIKDDKENVNGQPKFKMRSLNDIDVDPNANEYDIQESAKFFIEKEWMDKEDAQIRYPDIEEGVYDAYLGSDDGMFDLATFFTDDDDAEEEEGKLRYEGEDLDMKKQYRYFMRYVYWLESVECLLISDKKQNRTTILYDQDQIEKFSKKKSKRYETKSLVTHKLHKSTILGRTMLEDEVEPLGKECRKLPLVRFAPFWDEGLAQGILDDITGLNKEENIHRTQVIKLLNQTAGSGWKVKDGTNKKAMQNLANYGSVEGAVIDESKFGGSVEKIEPNKFPTGIFGNGQQFEQDIKRVSGVDDATQGYDIGGNESGRAIALKQQQNLTSQELVFNNFYHTIEMLGSMVLDFIRYNEVYTDEEIRVIVDKSSLLDTDKLQEAQMNMEQTSGASLPDPLPPDPPDPTVMSLVRPEDQLEVAQRVQMGMAGAQLYGEQYPRLAKDYEDIIEEHAIELLMAELKAGMAGEYGVKVAVADSSPTERLFRQAEMSEIQETYGVVPPDIFVDSTSLRQSDKEAIKSNIQAAQQAQQAQQVQGVA